MYWLFEQIGTSSETVPGLSGAYEPIYETSVIMLTKVEVTTETTMNSQEPAHCDTSICRTPNLTESGVN